MIGPGVASILRNGLYLLGSGWLAYGLRGLYVIALARFLGPDGYGLIAYAQALYVLLIGFIGLGMEIILPREVGRNRERGADVLRLLLTVRVVTTLVGAVTFLAIGLLAEPTATGRTVILILALALLGRSVAIMAQQAFVAFEASRLQLLVSAVFRTAELAAGCTALVLGADVVVVAAIHAASWVGEGLTALMLVDRRLAPLRGQRPWAGLPALLREGAVIGLSVALGTWLNAGPLVMYRYMAEDLGAVGILGLALQATMLIAGALGSFMTAAVPVLSRSVERADGRDANYLDAATRIGLVLATIGCLAGLAAGPWLVRVLAGADFTPAGALLGPALLLIGPIIVSAAAAQVFMVRGKATTPLYTNLAAAAVLTAALPPAATSFGASGVLVAIVAAWLVRAIVLQALVYHVFRRQPSSACIRVAAAAMVLIGAALALAPASVMVSALLIMTAVLVLPIIGLSANERGRAAVIGNRLTTRTIR